jgi:hypothetical protein
VSAITDEVVRKACDLFGPDFTLTLVKAHERNPRVSLLRDIASGDIPVVIAKARHATRGPDGVYQPDKITTDGPLPVTHSGAVHPFLREEYARQRRARQP